MSQRFFVSAPITQDHVILSGDEAHHLGRVMRGKVGDAVKLFDGSGAEFEAIVTAVGRSTVELRILAKQLVNREAPRTLCLGVAIPKGDRQRFLVEKAVEMGVATLTPLETTYGVAQPTANALERLRRAVVEASKQCGRNRLMKIADPVPLAHFLHEPSSETMRIFAHPSGNSISTLLPLLHHDMPNRSSDKYANDNTDVETSKRFLAADKHLPSIYAAIGPEGGFSDDEVCEASRAGWEVVNLGSRILRVETAALVLAAYLTIATE